jgi:hypothetical protein
MFLRRTVEHLRAQNWLALFLDFFIVVIGVFIGLQVDNWNQARIDQNKAYEQLILMNNDLTRDVEVLGELRDKIRRHVEGAQLILNSIGGSDAEAVEIEKAFTQLHLTYAYTPQQPTYLGLRNGAQLDLLQDTNLRSSIVEYYEIRQTSFQMEYMNDYAIAQRDLHEHFSRYVRFLPAERSSSLSSAPEDMHWTMLIAPISVGADDVGFLNALSEIGARGAEILGIIDALRSENDAIQEAIQLHVANDT